MGRLAAEGPEFHVAACHLRWVVRGIAPSRSLRVFLATRRYLQLWREPDLSSLEGDLTWVGRSRVTGRCLRRSMIPTRKAVANFLDGAAGAAGNLDQRLLGTAATSRSHLYVKG